MGNISEALINGFRVCAQENHFGNQILYNMCNIDLYPWRAPDRFADKMWIIGRSYAASPERRYIWKKGKKKEIHHGDGTGDFFYKVAEYIQKDKRYNELENELYDIRNKSYCYNGSATDQAQLITSISCVAAFNDMIKTASKKYDKNENKDSSIDFEQDITYKNQISFCSKFLHFHAPNIFFIFDQFSCDGSHLLCREKARRTAYLKEGNIIIDEEVISAINTCSQPVKISLNDIQVEMDDSAKNSIKEYLSHCVRAYQLGCFIRKISYSLPDLLPFPTPRIIDTIFLKTKRK